MCNIKLYQRRTMTPPVYLNLPNYGTASFFSFKATELDYVGPLYGRTFEKNYVLTYRFCC